MKSTQEERDETLRDRDRSRDLASAKWRSRSSFLLPLLERREMRRREIAIDLATPRDRDRSRDLASAKWRSRDRSRDLAPAKWRSDSYGYGVVTDMHLRSRNGGVGIKSVPTGFLVVLEFYWYSYLTESTRLRNETLLLTIHTMVLRKSIVLTVSLISPSEEVHGPRAPSKGFGLQKSESGRNHNLYIAVVSSLSNAEVQGQKSYFRDSGYLPLSAEPFQGLRQLSYRIRTATCFLVSSLIDQVRFFD
ncbi:hypothetical protein MRB53_013198 [Persea americana]|uniref:Uncharacterized protein n=1 Tax=Persea americana TaxID=3435 RepID=A0ACC2K7P8_PERAE|nr:hypothetical protein MRB53_013198 [Persea americana]